MRTDVKITEPTNAKHVPLDTRSLFESVGVIIFGAGREGIFVVQGPEITDFCSMYDLLQMSVDVLIFDDCVYVQSFLLGKYILVLLGPERKGKLTSMGTRGRTMSWPFSLNGVVFRL